VTRSARVPATSRADDDLRRAQNAWQNLVLAMHDIDPVTTEIVRVRAANHHDCRT
jgi:hypothetical protein